MILLLVAAGLDPTQWEFRRTIRVTQPNAVHAIRLDPQTLRHAQLQLADLRVVRGETPVPHLVRQAGGATIETLSPTLFDKVRTPAGELRFTLRLPKAEPHSRIAISTTDRDFRRPVRIETSPNGRTWDTALAKGYILDFTQNGQRLQSLEVDYPVSTQSFVRVTVGGWPNPATLTGTSMQFVREEAAAWTATAQSAPAQSAGESGQSHFTVDWGDPPPAWTRLRVETPTASFYRFASVDVSSDGKVWQSAAGGRLFRIGDSQSLDLTASLHRERWLRLRVTDGDDQPIAVSRIVLDTPTQWVRFVPKESGEYSLWYGNATASPARYDLAAVLRDADPARDVMIDLEGESRFAGFVSEKAPWTERQPVVFYGALAVAAVCIGVLVWRGLRTISPAA
ncbi:MAG: DUF3999 family protein [Bryobacteraceae bacterium]|nr:DUF3999 family protein [Bryobacteraceae bacterium]